MHFKQMAVAAACLFVNPLFSQNTEEKVVDTTITLKEFVIHENRISYQASEGTRNMEIISKKELKELPAQSLPEFLSFQPGLDIRQRGPVGVQADININGGSFEQTLVMLNGIKMSDPQTGHHLLNLPLMYDNLERIEIIKGPTSRKYGQNAYAGAVNFITKVPDSNKIHFRAYRGDFNSFGGNVSISNRSGKVGNYLSYGSDFSDGYRYNTDYKIQNFFYQGEVRLGEKSQLDLISGYTDRRFGANGFYASPKAIDQYEEVKTGIASIAYNYQNEDWKLSPRISWRNNRDRYQYIRQNPKVYENFHETDTYAAELNATSYNSLGQTGIGFEYRKESINGTWWRGKEFSHSNLDGFSRDNFGFYAEHKFLWKDFTLVPGVYIGWYSDFDWQFFPGASAGYFVTKNLKVYGNAGKSFRIPTFYDQYYTSPNEMGNENLEPENAWAYEAGVQYRKGKLLLEANTFLRDNQNLIDWVLINEVWHARNYAQIQTKGFEISLDYQENIELIGGNLMINNFHFSYNKLDQEQKDQEMLSRYALEHLSDQWIVSSNINFLENLNLNIVYRNLKRVEQPDYSLLDAKLSWRKGIFTAFVEVTNILDTEYTEVMTIMPGRWARAGVVLNVPY